MLRLGSYLLIGLLASTPAFAEQEHEFLSAKYWKTATLNDVKDMLDKGTSVKMHSENIDDNGIYLKDTPLMFASANTNNPEIIKLLVKNGAKVNEESHMGTALMDAAMSNPNVAILQTLIGLGAKVNVKRPNGSTALMLAAGFNSNPEIVRVLLKHGAKVNDADKGGETALKYAEFNKKKAEIEKILMEAGAK